MDPLVLEGLTVGITADRRAEEQAQMLVHRGAKVLHGPALRLAPTDPDDRTRAATVDLLASPPAVVIANTAVGIRAWLSFADAWGLDDELVAVMGRAYVASRGPKAAGALMAAGVEVDWRAPSSMMREVVDHVASRGIAGRRVALQLDGRGSDRDDAGALLRAAGADVVEVPTYRWSMPKDRAPALRLIDAACSGSIDAVTFTAAPAVHNLFTMAEDAGRATDLASALNGPVLAMCVGPVCRRAALERGVTAAREPQLARLGGMVKALADELGGRQRNMTVDGLDVAVQGALVRVGAVRVSLATRERAVFDVLSRRPGAVVGRPALLDEVWGSPAADPRALEVAVGRLRRRLRPTGLNVDAVVRRGYRLVFAAESRPARRDPAAKTIVSPGAR